MMGGGCESVLYVQLVRDEETEETHNQEPTKKCMILFRIDTDDSSQYDE